MFEIWKDGTKIDTLTTNKSGEATSKKLEPGHYTLKKKSIAQDRLYNSSHKGNEIYDF